MAKIKSKKNKSKKLGGDEDLKRMQEKYKRARDKEEGKTGRSEALDELHEGKNIRRILPREGTREFYLEVPIHFNVGPDGRPVRCLGKAGAGLTDEGYPTPDTKCPLCKLFIRERININAKYGKGSEEGKKRYLAAKQKYAPKVRYYMNTLRDDGSVVVTTCGEMIMGQLLEMYLDADSKVGDFTDPVDGRWLNIKKIKTGKSDRDVKYKVISSDDSEEIDLDELREKMHDLDAIAGEVLTVDQIKALMTGGLEEEEEDRPRKGKRRDEDEDEEDDDDDEEDDDEDEEEDDDEDEEEDDDEDEDDEDEDDDDEDEEDEDERPKKKRKSRR